jgi:hypothetical protein
MHALFRDALLSAALASASSTALGMLLTRRHGHPAPAVPNSVAHMGAGSRAARRRDWSRYSAGGLALNYFGCLFWAGVGELWVRVQPDRHRGHALARGAVMSGLAYAVDQHLLPARLRPAYDAVLPLPARLAVYASLALTLPLRSALAGAGAGRVLGRAHRLG